MRNVRWQAVVSFWTDAPDENDPESDAILDRRADDLSDALRDALDGLPHVLAESGNVSDIDTVPE